MWKKKYWETKCFKTLPDKIEELSAWYNWYEFRSRAKGRSNKHILKFLAHNSESTQTKIESIVKKKKLLITNIFSFPTIIATP